MKKVTVVIASLLLLSGCGDTGHGEKNGTITKLAVSGVFCKTNEMEIVRGGFNSGTGANGQPFDVTIEDPDLLSIAQVAIGTGAEIQITYRTEFFTFCRSDSDEHFLTSIKIIRPGIAEAITSNASTQPQSSSSNNTGVSSSQFQQLLDNQTRSIDQNERLLKVVESQQQEKYHE